MPLRIVSNDTAAVCAVSAQSRCSGDSGVSSSTPSMPRIAFMGVRISWLIAARKFPFARLACSAISFAAWSSRSVRTRSVSSSA